MYRLGARLFTVGALGPRTEEPVEPDGMIPELVEGDLRDMDIL